MAFGLIGSAAASAASTGGHSAAPAITYTSSQAGYLTQGASFRFVTSTVVVPEAAYSGGYAEVVLGGANVIPATLGVAAGGGPNSVLWNVVGPIGQGMAGGTLNLAPKPGDTVKLSIYFNRKGTDYFTATDVTQNQTVTLSALAPAQVKYTAAEVACLLTKPMAAPASDVRLWAFTNSAVTTYTGATSGSLTGPFGTVRVFDVNKAGQVVMSPSALWNSGRNFGAYLRAIK